MPRITGEQRVVGHALPAASMRPGRNAPDNATVLHAEFIDITQLQ